MSERDELIERLRAQRDHADDWRTTLAEQAADLLERDGAELERLRAENKRLTRERDDPGTTHADGCASWGPKHYACALARAEAAEKDAARYRWLRDCWFIAGEEFPPELNEGAASSAHFDDAIDAAQKEGM